MTHPFTSATFRSSVAAPGLPAFRVLLLVMLGLVGAGSPAWAENYVVTNPNKNATFNLVTGDELLISSNVNFGGVATVNGNNVKIAIDGDVTGSGSIAVNGTSSGTLIINSGDFAGILTVGASASGTVFNNLGTVPSQQVYLNSATTINNGSASATATAGVNWSGYVGNRFTAPVTINNFAAWTTTAQIQPLPGGTINNKNGATWAAYMTVSAPLTVNNEGAWSGQTQPASPGTPTFTLTNSGTWSGGLTANGFTTSVTNSGAWSSQIDYSGSLTIVHTAGTWTGLPNGNTGALSITNGGTWTKGGFNFPGTGPNSFTTLASGTTSFNGTVALNGVTALQNSGTTSLNQSSLLPSGASITNNAGGTFNLPLGSGSPATFTNAGTITNNGTLNATSGAFTNSGTINNGRAVIAVTGNFTNASTGTVTGPAAPQRGSLTATGVSTNSGVFGVVGRLDFCDASGPASGFDTAGGTIGGATTYCLNNPLPVVLTSFSAQAEKGQVQLRWNTAQERNSAKFVVERSADGESFQAVAETKAQGSSTRAVDYAAVDAKPLAGTSYYRLRQVDFDGATYYSKVATVRVEPLNQPVDLYPNPATDRLTLDLSTAPAAPCEVRVVSPTGQVWLATSLPGGQLRELPLAGVPAGLYLLHVRTAQGGSVQRLEKR